MDKSSPRKQAWQTHTIDLFEALEKINQTAVKHELGEKCTAIKQEQGLPSEMKENEMTKRNANPAILAGQLRVMISPEETGVPGEMKGRQSKLKNTLNPHSIANQR